LFSPPAARKPFNEQEHLTESAAVSAKLTAFRLFFPWPSRGYLVLVDLP
jgi:hypothetical protein